MLARLQRGLIRRFYPLMLASNPHITIEGPLHIYGRPILDLRRGGTLILGAGVTLNSTNAGYHINMHSPVKIMADQPGAVVRIGDRTRIHGTCIHAFDSITVGANCLIAANCQIFDGNGHEPSFDNPAGRLATSSTATPVVIGDNVWVGANTLILPGVHIGSGSIVAAGSVVTKDIPPLCLAAGNPARIIRTHADHN